MVRPASLHPTQHPTPVRCNTTLRGSDRLDAPTHLQTPPLFLPTQSSSHRAPFPSPVSPVAPSTPPPTKRAPPPRPRAGPPHFTDETIEAASDDIHGGTGALRAPLHVCWVPSSPSPPAHRTHLQPSLRSLPSSQRSFGRGRAGRGQGRGISDRALAAGICSPAGRASRRLAPPPGLHLPGGNAGSRLATGPPHPPSGQLALKGTRP